MLTLLPKKLEAKKSFYDAFTKKNE
jgi:hypothetical protein